MKKTHAFEADDGTLHKSRLEAGKASLRHMINKRLANRGHIGPKEVDFLFDNHQAIGKIFEETYGYYEPGREIMAHIPTLHLLAEILRRDVGALAPTQTTRHTPHQEYLVGIGRDHTASIVLEAEAVTELRALTETKRFATTDDPVADLQQAGPGGEGGGE